MSMSPAAIYDQLISEYGEKFTAEEAQYAIDNLQQNSKLALRVSQCQYLKFNLTK